MPSLETPPNPVESPAPPETPKLAAGRYGALDHSEIVHLLSTLDDEVARSRFRESIYISLIICLALAWFAFYGPRVLFHQGRIVNVADNNHKNEMTFLETPKDLSKILPKPTRNISDHSTAAQTAHPEPKPPTPRPGAPGQQAPPRPQPRPQPQQQSQPQPRPQPQPQQPLPSTPQPQPQPRPQQANNNIPDAPHPNQAPTRPNFSTPSQDPGQAVRDAARNAAQRGQGGEDGPPHPIHGHTGANTGVEVLSDTLGTDFGPYLKRLLRSTRAAWIPLIPEECSPPLNKTGMTLVRFTIQPNGVVSAMHLDDSTRDQAIDRAAWGSITSQGQLPPLPATFKGPNLELRIQFNIYNDGSATH